MVVEKSKSKIQEESKDNIIKNIKNTFKLKKENKTDKIIGYLRNLFELDTEDYCKAIRVGNFCSISYIEYESNSDRDKNYQLKNILIKLNHT